MLPQPNMAIIVWGLLMLLISRSALCAPQEDADADADADVDADADADGPDYELDYFVPGEPTEDCLCVPFDQCIDGEIVDDGTNIIIPRKKPQEEELPLDEKYVFPECGPYHECCRNPETSTPPPYEHRCGTRNTGGINGRILTSQATGEAEIGEWPWQAAILLKDGAEYIFKCGATFIDERHVLTVAHCVQGLENKMTNIVIRLGEWDTRNTDTFFLHEDYNVSKIMIHPQYRASNLFNDIAILKLDKDVEFKPHIDTACLPRDEDDFTGQECVVTGWGKNAYENGSFLTIMKEVNVPVIGHDECQNMLRKTRLGKNFKLHSGFMCAGGKEGEDSCKGDGGGPLVCYRSDNSYTVAGLVSWGVDCGQLNVPGVYINVRKYIDWIASKTQKPLQDYWSKE